VQITVSKLVATVIACVYAVAIIVEAKGALAHASKALGLLLPMALIWFPEEIGEFTGYSFRGHRIDTETPPFLVSAAGWFLLVGVPAVIYLLS
jgi:hypothetical protein